MIKNINAQRRNSCPKNHKIDPLWKSSKKRKKNSCPKNHKIDPLWKSSTQTGQQNDEEIVDSVVLEQSNYGNLLYETKKEDKAKALIQSVKKFVEDYEIDGKILRNKVARSILRTYYNKNAGERAMDGDILPNFFESKLVQLLEEIYQKYHKRKHSKMNWLAKIRRETPYKEEGLLTNAELTLLVNAGKSGEGRTYWVCSVLDLVICLYQSNKHIGNIFTLSETILKKIGLDRCAIHSKVKVDIYDQQRTIYHTFLYKCFPYLPGLLEEVSFRMSSLCIKKIGDSLVSQTRLLVVPATKEILTIIMGEVDQKNFKFKKSIKERRPLKIDKEAELIDNKIKEEYDCLFKTEDLKIPPKDRNYRDILNQKRDQKRSRERVISESCNVRSRQTSRVASINQSRSISKATQTDFDEQVNQTPDADNNPTSPSTSTQRSQNTTTRNDEASVFVGNLHYFTTEQELREAFAKYGYIRSVKIIRDWETGNSKGFGFVKFVDPICAADAISDMDGYDLRGRSLRVSLKKKKKRTSH